MIGKTLAHYEVTGLLGKGGMGEVYRARDTKLDRDVALKILPDIFGRDPERVARFQREARTLASLNHNCIASIYGFEESEGLRFLVMELVEGEDLSEKLASGALPLDEALDIARQIADGLEEAHEEGVVHRDLKPANVKVTPDGRVKILDFGLARAFQGEAVDEGELQNSPTITAAMTQAGVILGTAAYMSPEQARGKVVDRRSDLWAFGVVLWEMLTGKRLFEGEDTSDTLAAVLRKEPEWEDLPEATPLVVVRLLERCLERDPRQRLRDIGEARVRLEQWTTDPSTMTAAIALPDEAEKSPLSLRMPWLIAALAIAIALWGWLVPRSAQQAEELRPNLVLDLALPEDDTIQDANGANIQMSPDGSLIAYLTTNGIRLRRLDQREDRLLSGTEQAGQFTFSPDGEWIAFAARGRLARVSITGGAPIDICDAPDPRGLAWVNEGTIVFAPHYFRPLVQVSLHDGSIQEVTSLDTESGERTHRWPVALPDGKSILYMCQYLQRKYDEGEIRILTLGDTVSTSLYRGGSFPLYAESGHLLFTRDRSVFAVALDLEARTTVGLAVPVLSGLMASIGDQDSDDGSVQMHLSKSGTLIYRSATEESSLFRVVQIDVVTGQERILTDPGGYRQLVISPDGNKLAMSRDSDLYILDINTGLESRFSFVDGWDELGCFTSDSRTLYWGRTTPTGIDHIYRRAIDGSTAEELLFTSNESATPRGLTADESRLALDMWGVSNQWDIGLLPIGVEDAEPEMYLGGENHQLWASFSPDGKWVLYFSDETGSFEMYVRRFPETGARWLAAGGRVAGDQATWGADGRSIFYRNHGGTYRLPYAVEGESFVVGKEERISVDDHAVRGGSFNVSIDPTGRYVYVLASESDSEGPGFEQAIVLETNWLDGLKRKFNSR